MQADLPIWVFTSVDAFAPKGFVEKGSAFGREIRGVVGRERKNCQDCHQFDRGRRKRIHEMDLVHAVLVVKCFCCTPFLHCAHHGCRRRHEVPTIFLPSADRSHALRVSRMSSKAGVPTIFLPSTDRSHAVHDGSAVMTLIMGVGSSFSPYYNELLLWSQIRCLGGPR